MKKRIIISEEEKKQIREMYNLDEGWGETFLNKIKIVKKFTGKELDDVTSDDLNKMSSEQRGKFEKEVESDHSFGIGDVVTILRGDNQGHRMEIVYIEGNTISLNTGDGMMDYPAKNLRKEPPGTKTTIWIADGSADGSGMDYIGGKNNNVYNTSGVVSPSEFLKNREWNGSEWVPKKS